MKPIRHEIPRTWTTQAEGRECGDCYACCIWLGVEELKKYTGQTCKHLCGGSDPTKRCSIYPSRPIACAEYQCMWRAGWGPDEMRPADSGLLITVYQSETNSECASATMNIFDPAKAKLYMEKTIGELLTIPIIDEIRVINIPQKTSLLFRDGNIYRGILMPAEGYESLTFTAQDKPIGRYEVRN